MNAGLVYMVKGSMKSKAGRKRRKAAKVARVAKVTANGSSPVVLIKKVRALADEAGGMKALQELIGVLAE